VLQPENTSAIESLENTQSGSTAQTTDLEFYSEVREVLNIFKYDMDDAVYKNITNYIQAFELVHQSACAEFASTPLFFLFFKRAFDNVVRQKNETLMREFFQSTLGAASSVSDSEKRLLAWPTPLSN
jgi:hypothetical protein